VVLLVLVVQLLALVLRLPLVLRLLRLLPVLMLLRLRLLLVLALRLVLLALLLARRVLAGRRDMLLHLLIKQRAVLGRGGPHAREGTLQLLVDQRRRGIPRNTRISVLWRSVFRATLGQGRGGPRPRLGRRRGGRRLVLDWRDWLADRMAH
jgi:hypothetical protein